MPIVFEKWCLLSDEIYRLWNSFHNKCSTECSIKLSMTKAFKTQHKRKIKTWYILTFLNMAKNIIKNSVLATNPVFSRVSRVTTLYDKRKSD